MGIITDSNAMHNLPPRRVLIIRLSAIGDIVMASGLSAALRTLWPDAHIAWLAEQGPAQLLKEDHHLNEVIELPRQRWKKMSRDGQRMAAWKEMAAFARQLRNQSYDLTLDLQGLIKSGIWAYASGAPQRIGLGSREGSQWLMTETLPRNETDPRMGKEYRALAMSLGAPESSFIPSLVIPESARLFASEHLNSLRGHAEKIAILAPFTTRPQKHWFDSSWLELAALLNDSGFHSLILGGPADLAHTESLTQEPAGYLTSLTGQTSLIESAALIQAADLMIGVDTGLTHMGMALGIPTVALFGSTRPYWETERPSAEILYHHESCSPCHRRPTCGEQFTCMQHHTPESVFAAAIRVTQASSARALQTKSQES
jgi:heptosyltransferase-1